MSQSDNHAEHENEQPQPEEQAEAPLSPEELKEYTSFADEAAPQDAPPVTPEAAAPATNEPSEEQVRISLLEEELDRTKEQMMRAVAEAENGRKRALKEREDASKFAIAGFSRDLLSVADNLRRALDAVPAELLEEHEQVKNLIDGIEATERELLRSFEKNGIEKTDPIDQPFDPNFHEVMFETPMPDKPNGTIIQVIEPGYTINDRILRPARVGVAKNDGDAHPPGSSEPGQNINTEV